MQITENIELLEVNDIELPWVTFSLLERDILYLRFRPFEDEIDLEKARKHSKAVSDLLGGGSAHFVLNFQGTHIVFSNEARDYFASDANHTNRRKSQAIVIDNLAHKIVANFYLRFNKPKGPTRIFEDLEEAFKWTLSETF